MKPKQFVMELSKELHLLMKLSKITAKLARSFDHRLNGISATELIILFHLFNTPKKKMRRIELAEALGLTASGITRLLLPMEKIGLVGRESGERDARVKFATLAPGGEEKLKNELGFANEFAESRFVSMGESEIEKTTEFLDKINF